MIISYKYKFVFIHIPKTAGSFIKHLIITKIDPECESIDLFNNRQLSGHHTINNIINMDIYEKIKDFKFFTIIRNPIDLIISNYNYIVTEKNHYLHKIITNFKDYIEYISKYPLAYTNVYFLSKNDGEIDFNIKFIKNEKMNDDLKNFFISCGVESEKLENLNELIKIKINVSERYINNIDLLLNKEYYKQFINFYKNEYFIKDYLFYNSV